jgi:preprotein translocase subunit SecG
MKKFLAVFAALMFVGSITLPVIAQAQTQAPKGTEGPDVRKGEQKKAQ